MATQNMRSLDTILNGESPQSLYELLIYDNHKLAEQSDGPHIIMRRSVKGSEPDYLELLSSEEPPQPEQVVEELSIQAEEKTEQDVEDSDLEQEELEHTGSEQEQVEQPEEVQSELVSANEITSYLASLSSHVQSDVLRVVDAIIELEESEQAAVPQSKGQPDLQEPDQDNLFEENDSNKGLEIADIFTSLKKARKRAQQKSYSYTKKVEYEDQ